MKTILLIESDPTSLVAQSLLLRCFGYVVLEASNQGEAWLQPASGVRSGVHPLAESVAG